MTACPTGIAHTYMAAEALEAAAARAGVDIAVETQGSAGSTPLRPDVIARADAAIFAVDVGVRDRGRFAGKPLVASGRQAAHGRRGLDDRRGPALRRRPGRPARRGRGGRRRRRRGHAPGGGGGESWGRTTRRVLMTGVSYMIPFVAAGGLLIALSFLLGGYEIVGPFKDILSQNSLLNLPDPASYGLDHALFDSGFFAYVGAIFFVLGKTAFAFFIPALAGYIAFAIADRPGIAPGFVMGGLAADVMQFGTPQTGFLGAIVGGVLAGVIAALDRPAQGAVLGPRPDAGAGHPAVHHDRSPAS